VRNCEFATHEATDLSDYCDLTFSCSIVLQLLQCSSQLIPACTSVLNVYLKMHTHIRLNGTGRVRGSTGPPRRAPWISEQLLLLCLFKCFPKTAPLLYQTGPVGASRVKIGWTGCVRWDQSGQHVSPRRMCVHAP